MTETYFTETYTDTPVETRKGRWLVAVATPGQGSSGHYSEDLLREYGPAALPANSKCFLNHDNTRKPTDIVGVYTEGAYWDADRKQLMAELDVFPRWQDFISEMSEHIALSISMAGESDENGIVTKLTPNRSNSADVVAIPGLEGSGFVELLESARRVDSVKPPVALAEDHQDGKDATRMEEKLDKLIELMTAFAATKTAEAQETAQVTADETLAQERIDAFESSVDAIEAADLTTAQKKALRVEAKAGSDVTKLIEAQVALKAEILQESGAQLVEGRVVTSGATSSFSTNTLWGSK